MIGLLPQNMRKKIAHGPIPTTCWLWTGAVTSSGYGSFVHEGRAKSTHRLPYELIVGPIPHGLHIDHLCRNKKCCNPEHLEPVTPIENRRRDIVARYGQPHQMPAGQKEKLMQIFRNYFGETR